MIVIGDKNQISEDLFDFMLSFLLIPQKSIRSELATLFSISIYNLNELSKRLLDHFFILTVHHIFNRQIYIC